MTDDRLLTHKLLPVSFLSFADVVLLPAALVVLSVVFAVLLSAAFPLASLALPLVSLSDELIKMSQTMLIFPKEIVLTNATKSIWNLYFLEETNRQV